MKILRHSKIFELIEKKDIETQDELSSELKKLGFDVTQATVSRDIKELGLLKLPHKDGRSKYAPPQNASGVNQTSKLNTILQEAVVNVDFAKNLAVIKTISGMAQAAAYVIDAMQWQGIVGTIAGDDTVMIVLRTDQDAKQLTAKLKKILN